MDQVVLMSKNSFGENQFAEKPNRNSVQRIEWRILHHADRWRPPTDIYETVDNVVVRIEAAGMKPNDFKITIDERLLVVQGARQDTNEKRAYQQMEIYFGTFNIEIILPCNIQVEKVSAEYQDGFLTITMPKAMPQKISIQK